MSFLADKHFTSADFLAEPKMSRSNRLDGNDELSEVLFD